MEASAGTDNDDNPRRPSQVHKFEAMPQLSKGRRGRSSATQQEPGSFDFVATLSMLLGVGGMATRVKLLVWLAVFTCLSAGANLRRSDGDVRAVVGAFMYVRARGMGVRVVMHLWLIGRLSMVMPALLLPSPAAGSRAWRSP